jgi:hypothetical protein
MWNPMDGGDLKSGLVFIMLIAVSVFGCMAYLLAVGVR